MRRIAIDLDGVLAEYHGHEQSEDIGKPIPGAVEFVAELVGGGWQVVVFSRNRHPAAVNEWLLQNGFGDIVAGIAVVPPDTTVILDDRGLRFDGDFGEVLSFLKGDPRPWWRKSATVGS